MKKLLKQVRDNQTQKELLINFLIFIGIISTIQIIIIIMR